MRASLGAALVAALALVLAAPAVSSAAPAGSSAAPARQDAVGPRAAARAFGAAADRFDAATRQAMPEIRRRIEALTQPACAQAIAGAPREVAEIMAEIVLGLSLDAVVTPLRPRVDAFVAELAAVRTRDRALRSGRAGWRRVARLFATVEPAPPDPCAQLQAWQAAGYPPDAVPPLPRATEEEAERLKDTRGAERRIRAAGRRMLRLGVPRKTVRRFTGRALERSLARVLEQASGTPSAAR